MFTRNKVIAAASLTFLFGCSSGESDEEKYQVAEGMGVPQNSSRSEANPIETEAATVLPDDSRVVEESVEDRRGDADGSKAEEEAQIAPVAKVNDLDHLAPECFLKELAEGTDLWAKLGALDNGEVVEHSASFSGIRISGIGRNQMGVEFTSDDSAISIRDSLEKRGFVAFPIEIQLSRASSLRDPSFRVGSEMSTGHIYTYGEPHPDFVNHSVKRNPTSLYCGFRE